MSVSLTSLILEPSFIPGSALKASQQCCSPIPMHIFDNLYNCHYLLPTPILTYAHDPAEHRRVVHSAAIPPPLTELVLALFDGVLGPLTDIHHVLLVELAQLPLAWGQPWQLAAHRLSSDDVHLGSLDWIHSQRPGMGNTL